jgi:hypothetical protein
MSINFNRNRTQSQYEQLVGIYSIEELSQKQTEFKSHSLIKTDIDILKPCLNEDSLDYFYNGILSFSEGIDAIFLKRFSWATVKLYYCVYYMLRASLACKGYALLQANGMYRLQLKESESPYKTGNKKYNSTHSGTINHYIDIFGGDDKLLTNQIDSRNAYEWIEEVRNVINYRAVSFQEPNWLDIWDKYAEALENSNLNELLLKIQDDQDFIYCFQEEYAIVGIPIKRVYLTIKDLVNYGLLSNLDIQRKLYAMNLVKYNERDLKILNSFYQT